MSRMSMTVQKSKNVFRCASYFGRVYVHLRGRNSSYAGDVALQIMVSRQGVLTITRSPKDEMSETMAKSLADLRTELEAAGAVSDQADGSIVTYTF